MSATPAGVIKDMQRHVRHPAIPWMAATLDGVVEETGAVFEAKFMLPWSFSEEAAAEKHMAQLQHNMWVTNCQAGGAVDYHRRRQMGRDHGADGSALSDRSGRGREEVLALRADRAKPPRLINAEPPRPRIEAIRIVDMSAPTPGPSSPRCSATPGRPSSTMSGPRASSRP